MKTMVQYPKKSDINVYEALLHIRSKTPLERDMIKIFDHLSTYKDLQYHVQTSPQKISKNQCVKPTTIAQGAMVTTSSPASTDVLVSCLVIAEMVHNAKLLQEVSEVSLKLGGQDNLLPQIRHWRQRIAAGEADATTVYGVLRAEGMTDEAITQLAADLQRAQALTAQRVFLLETVQRYLLPLPLQPAYDRLHLSQKMVRSYLRYDTLRQNPQLVEGALMAAFREYKKLYVAQYCQELETYYTEIKAIHKAAGPLLRRLQALEQLDQLRELGAPCAGTTRAEVETFLQAFPVALRTRAERKAEVEHAGLSENFTLGMVAPTEAFAALTATCEQKLHEKLQALKQRTIRQVVEHKGADAVSKLLALIQISNLDEVVDLLVADQSGETLHALKTIVQQPFSGLA